MELDQLKKDFIEAVLRHESIALKRCDNKNHYECDGNDGLAPFLSIMGVELVDSIIDELISDGKIEYKGEHNVASPEFAAISIYYRVKQ